MKDWRQKLAKLPEDAQVGVAVILAISVLATVIWGGVIGYTWAKNQWPGLPNTSIHELKLKSIKLGSQLQILEIHQGNAQTDLELRVRKLEHHTHEFVECP